MNWDEELSWKSVWKTWLPDHTWRSDKKNQFKGKTRIEGTEGLDRRKGKIEKRRKEKKRCKAIVRSDFIFGSEINQGILLKHSDHLLWRLEALTWKGMKVMESKNFTQEEREGQRPIKKMQRKRNWYEDLEWGEWMEMLWSALKHCIERNSRADTDCSRN